MRYRTVGADYWLKNMDKEEEVEMAKILLVGLDAGLLETRHQVLRLTGAEVISARAELAFRLIEEQKFGMVLVCYTVPEDVRERLCTALDRCCAGSWVVLLERHQTVALCPDSRRLTVVTGSLDLGLWSGVPQVS